MLDQLPNDPLLQDRITIRTVAWDKPGAGTPMSATMTPQEAIDRGLPKPSECDIVVVVLWTRMGTPLPPDLRKPDGTRYLSGTQWEYEDAFRSDQKRPILVYRRTEKHPIAPGDPEFEQKSAQQRNVDRFFADFQNPDGSARSGYKQYARPEDFARLLEADVKAVIKDLLDGPGEQVRIYLSVGDRLAAKRRYIEALDQYQRALQVAPKNVEVNRRVISARRDKLLLEAFGPHSSIGIGLRHDLSADSPFLRLAPESEVDDALRALYQVQALSPALLEDIGLLVDEALILKTGLRFGEAVAVLRKAHARAPANTEVLAELGLLLALFSKDSQQVAEGISLLRDALRAEPDAARFHFYMAHALAESCRCPYAGLEYSNDDAAEACAEAIREYHRAADLAAAGDDIWRVGPRARECSMDIFHRYARKEQDILTPNLAMPFEERLRELQYLVPGASTSQTGLHDEPRFWIVALQRATGNLEQAEREMRTLLKENHDKWLGQEMNYWEDPYYVGNRLPWFDLFAKILEEGRTDPDTLTTVRSLMRSAQ